MPCAWCAANWPPGQLFPPECFPATLAALLVEIGEERAVSSRGRRIPRGLKRKMSTYPLRRARAPTRPLVFPVKIRFPTK